MSEDMKSGGVESAVIPRAQVLAKPRRWSWVWLMPMLASAAMGYVLWGQVSRERGPTVVVRFEEAGGIQVGTELRHRGIRTGVVRKVGLDDDFDGVSVEIELDPSSAGLARKGTKFWLVRAQVGFGKIAGLDTLLGPNYIALRPGGSDDPSDDPSDDLKNGSGDELGVFVFDALVEPPASEAAEDGSLRLVLISDRLGTLSPGNPVLYREIRVGTVRGAQLTNDATKVMISIDIDPKYVPLIYDKTRFWRSGGVGVDFGIFSGLSVQADSLEAAMSSSVSLATPEKRMGEKAGVGAVFELADEVDGDWLKWSPGIGIGG